MTSPALTVDVSTAVEEIARLMSVHQINRLPVLRSGSLVGVVAHGDVLDAIAHIEHHDVDDSLPPELVSRAGPQWFPMGD